MTNEGLKVGALALGIVLVILIIVLVVRHHKDKYEDVDSGRLKDVDGGCCSLTNNIAACGTGVPPKGGTWNLSKGCISAAGPILPTPTEISERCICNGNGTCTTDATDGLAICSCLYNLSDDHACSKCPTGYVPPKACAAGGVLCPGYQVNQTSCTTAGFDQACTFLNANNDEIATACVKRLSS